MADSSTQEQELKKLLAARLAELPGAVQSAITSVDVPARLQELSKTHNLHMDQWQTLENEVMLTILGFQPADELGKHIQNRVILSAEIAQALTEDIGRTIFNPIREELERELGHPQAKTEELSDIEKVRQQAIKESSEQKTVSSEKQPVVTLPSTPGTPPASPPTEKIVRAPASGAYKPGETSAARADVHDDPYREPPL